MDGAVIATATELFEARHFPGVVALCSDALDDEPECVGLLLIRARARMALRRDLDAQADLRDVIRLDPTCALAYRLLGELAARRDEHRPAAVFFREALRLAPGDREALEWLQIVDALPPEPAPRRASASTAQPRLARGTQPVEPHDYPERPTRPLGHRPGTGASAVARPRGAAPGSPNLAPTAIAPPVASATPVPSAPSAPSVPVGGAAGAYAGSLATGSVREPAPPRVGMSWHAGAYRIPAEEPAGSTLTGLPAPQPPAARPAPRTTFRARAAVPELPGFGEYLVSAGILTRDRLRAAEAYQRSMRVQLSTAIVTLGLATPQRVEWAAVAHQAQLASRRL